MADQLRTMEELVTPKVEQLAYAKRAVQAILDRPGVLVDMHGLRYWAGRVEDLREEIKEAL